MPTFTLAELSEQLGEPYEGDGALLITNVGEITAAREGMLSFVANPKYVTKISDCKASALIIPKELETDFRPVIRAANPYLTFTKALSLFHQDNRRISGGVHPASQMAEGVHLGREVTVMPHVIVEEGASIGDRSVLYPGVFIGKHAVIGNDVTLYPHVTIGDGCRVEDKSILHGGCRIGSGSIYVPEGTPPVVLGADVELGANVVVGGTAEMPTRIGDGTKIDNLVQIGRGSSLGLHCIVVAQVNIGENVRLEDHVVIAGQVVLAPHITVGARARIGAKSVVAGDVPPDADFWGDPAQPIHQEKRMKANLARLPRLFEKIVKIEERLEGGN